MLEQIKKIAMEKYASEEELNAFMEGFEKEASLSTVFNAFNTIGMGKDGAKYVTGNLLTENAAKAGVGLGAALLGALIYKGVTSGTGAIENNSLRSKFEGSLTQAINSNRIIRSADPVKVKQYAETIFKFAPHVAADPNLLNFTLANIVQGESGIDLVTMKTLTDLEGRYKDNTKSNPILGFK